jgi:hypothetical protein
VSSTTLGLLFLAASGLNGYMALKTSKQGRFDPKGLDAIRSQHPTVFRAGVGMYWLLCGTAAVAGLIAFFGLLR